MSWEQKTDYAGLAGNLLVVKESNENASSQFLEKPGQKGVIAATKLYGTKSAGPSTTYVIVGSGDLVVQIGKVTTVGEKRFALASVVYAKTAGGEPTLTATSVRIEDASHGTEQLFEPVTIHIDPEETAEFCLDAATVSGEACEVTQVTTTVSGTVNPHTVNGDPVASGVHSGKVEIDVSVGQYGETDPTIAPKSPFVIAQAPAHDDPDSDMPTWTVKLMKPLAKVTE